MIAALRRPAALHDEHGLTLIELALVMMVLSLISAMSYSALDSANRVTGSIDDEARGLADLKTVVERMTLDLRAARGVDSTASASQLTIWIDSDSDYVQTPDETITWQIAGGATAGQFDVLRKVQGGSTQTVGSSLVSDIAFSYSPTPASSATRTVTVQMSYDAIPGLFSSPKLVNFEVRMRNVQ